MRIEKEDTDGPIRESPRQAELRIKLYGTERYA
jgi:hypothetical protein